MKKLRKSTKQTRKRDGSRKRKASEHVEPETKTNKRSRVTSHYSKSRTEKIYLKKEEIMQINVDEGVRPGTEVIDTINVFEFKINVDFKRGVGDRNITGEEVDTVQIPREIQNNEECKNVNFVLSFSEVPLRISHPNRLLFEYYQTWI